MSQGHYIMTPILLSNDGCDRATAYHMSSKIVRHKDGMFVTWLNDKYQNIVAQIDPNSAEVLQRAAITQGIDNHCGATMAIDGNDRLHVISGAHATGGFIYQYNDTPLDPGAWSLPESVGSASTYPSLVVMPNENLMVAYRHTGFTGKWGSALQLKEKGDDTHFGWPRFLMVVPAPNYTFPTNSMMVGPDGTIHIIMEFYKTYPEQTEPSKSHAVTHLTSKDNADTWQHDDGREVTWIPIGLEDASLIDSNPAGNLRIGNLTVTPDNKAAFCIWNAHTEELILYVQNDAGWCPFNLTEHVTDGHDGWKVNSQGRVCIDEHGNILITTTIAPDSDWSHPGQHIRLLWWNPGTESVSHVYTVPKSDPNRAAWLASVEKTGGAPAEHPVAIMYTDGNRGQGCANDAVCNVHLLFADINQATSV
jgi:hypothetical protein